MNEAQLDRAIAMAGEIAEPEYAVAYLAGALSGFISEELAEEFLDHLNARCNDMMESVYAV